MRVLVALIGMALIPTAVGGAPPPPSEALVVPTGRAPCGLAARAGSLWVGVYEAEELLSIDARGRIESRVRLGPWSCSVAVGPKAVWVTRDRADEVVRISRGSGRLKRVRVAEPFDVLLAAGSLWVTSYETGVVTKRDPVSGAMTATVPVGANPTGLAACGGRIWVGHGRSAMRITSIDPESMRVRRIAVGATPFWPHCIRGGVWVTTPDSVLRLDARTGDVLSRLHIGETLADAAAAPDGLVWVTDKQHSVVHRVSPDGSSLVDSFPAGPGTFALAGLGGSMWITSFAGADVRRFDP